LEVFGPTLRPSCGRVTARVPGLHQHLPLLPFLHALVEANSPDNRGGVVDGDEDLLAIVVPMVADPTARQEDRTMDESERCFEIGPPPKTLEENLTGTGVDA